jgi:hypothetical protein
MSDLRPVKWKRRPSGADPKPSEALRRISCLSLRGTLAHGAAFLALEPRHATLLDKVCLGKLCRGAAAEGAAQPWLQLLAAERAQRAAEREQQRPGEAEAAEAPDAGEEDEPPGEDLPTAPPAADEPAVAAADASAPSARWGRAAAPKPAVVVRLSLLEAVFLLHALDCLTLYEETPDAPPLADSLTALQSPESAAAFAAWRAGGAAPQHLSHLLSSPAPPPAAGEPPRPHPPGLRALSDFDVWSLAVAAQPGFPAAYRAYLHCRSRGWLVRSGLQYGADYVLYPRHPSLAHSTLTALVVPATEGPGGDSAAAAAARAGWPRWPELQALSRLCVQVNKGLLLLHVVPCVDDGRRARRRRLRTHAPVYGGARGGITRARGWARRRV